MLPPPPALMPYTVFSLLPYCFKKSLYLHTAFPFYSFLTLYIVQILGYAQFASPW